MYFGKEQSGLKTFVEFFQPPILIGVVSVILNRTHSPL